MTRLDVYFSGRVQGVGFRYTACFIARRYPVKGYVCNLADGRVEAVVEGDVISVKRFLDDLREEFAGHIRECQINESAATGEFEGFAVRH